MSLKQERPEMDAFERRTKFGCQGKLEKFQYLKKILGKMQKRFLKDTLTKTSQNIFVNSFVSEYTKHFFNILHF